MPLAWVASMQLDLVSQTIKQAVMTEIKKKEIQMKANVSPIKTKEA